MFSPRYQITAAITRTLMAIEADRQAIDLLPVDVAMLTSLRQTARLAATHYSTQIEGNRLTLAQVSDAVAGAQFPGRERDQREVRYYYRALEGIESLAARPGPLAEADLQRIHGLVVTGQSRRSPYRGEQNVIRDSSTGGIVYLPPEAKDVPPLMAALVAWINRELDAGDLPAPLVGGLAHYQYAIIHPYFDGNGRTARLLTTLILHKAGYGLKGIYSLDEYYARNLPEYYAALTVGPSHNYYMGRADADLTGFLTYFCRGMAEAFGAVRTRAMEAAQRQARDVAGPIRQLDPRQRRLLQLFQQHGIVTSAQIATHLQLSHDTVVRLCRAWLGAGFLALHNPSRKNRSYRLAEKYESLLGHVDRR